MPKHRRKSTRKAWKKADIDDITDGLAQHKEAERSARLLPEQVFSDAGKTLTRAEKRSKLQKELDGIISDEVYRRGPKPRRSKRIQHADHNRKRTANKAFDPWDDAPALADAAAASDLQFPIEDPRPVKRRRYARSQILVQDGTQVAHPGASVNPDREQHAALVQAAGEALIEQARPENDARVVMYNIFRKTEAAAAARAGQASDDDAEEQEEAGEAGAAENEEAEAEDAARVSVPDPLKRKTRVQLNRKRRLHEEAMQLKARKQGKLLDTELQLVAKLSKQATESAKAHIDELYEKAEARQRQAMADPESVAPKRLGKHPYVKLVPSVTLPEDLTQTLRKVEPLGNPLEEAQDLVRRRRYVPVSKRQVPYRKHKQELYSRYKEKDVENAF